MNKLKLFKTSHERLFQIIFTVVLAVLLSAGIVKAATTIGNNITTGGTITSNGANTLYGATSIGGALTATSTLNVTGLTTLGNASTTLLTVSGNSWLATTTNSKAYIGDVSYDFGGSLPIGFTTGLLDIGAYNQRGIGIETHFNDDTLAGSAAPAGLLMGTYADVGNTTLNHYGLYSYIEAPATGMISGGVLPSFVRGARIAASLTGTGTLDEMMGMTSVFEIYNQPSTTNTTVTDAYGELIDFYVSGDTNGGVNTNTLTSYSGLKIRSKVSGSLVPGTGAPTVAGTNWNQLYITDFANYHDIVTNVSGIWIEPMGANLVSGGYTPTLQSGITLDGNGIGSDIKFGEAQQISMSRDSVSGNLQWTGFNTTALGFMGAKMQYDLIATQLGIFTPYAWWGMISPDSAPSTNSAAELDFTANNYDLTYASGNVASSDLITYGGNRALVTTGDDEIVKYTDSGANFTFLDATGGNGFSAGAWVYVTTGSAIQHILTKAAGGGVREYQFSIDGDEYLTLVLWSGATSCTQKDSVALTPGWYFVGFTYAPTDPVTEDANDNVTLYVDGVARTPVANSSCPGYTGMADTAANLNIGGTNGGGTWDGSISTTFVTAAELTAEQWAQTYTTARGFYGK